MRRSSLKIICSCMAFLTVACGSSFVRGEQPTRILFDFDGSNASDQWRTVNDGVMGGLSDGRFRLTEEGSLNFFGELSLKNNGGFTSVRSQSAELELDDGDVIVARVRGDGRRYYLNARTGTPRLAFSYRTEFQTKAGQWQEIRVPLSDLRATWFGRQVPGASPVEPASVNSMGFLLADKIPGSFQLEVDWIKIASDDDV